MRRGRSPALVLGFGALVPAWIFGSTAVAVAGSGFLLAGLLGRWWTRAVAPGLEFERQLGTGDGLEGSDVVVEVRVRRLRRLLVGSVLVRQRLGEVEREARMRGGRAGVVFPQVPRGRHELAPAELTITDPLGLERAVERIEPAVTILVRPRVPVLTSVFSAHGVLDSGAARSAFRRPLGFEIHAVRDYVPGEPLRSVHWPSTARRGRLMVKELDDAPRDDLAIILDQDRDGVAGPPGGSSFDAAVRAAGAIALAHVRSGRHVTLLGTAPGSPAVHVRSQGHDWEVALDALATAMPVAGARVDLVRRDPVVTRARELVVVTGRPDRAIGPLLELRRGGRAVSLVVVASETYAGRARPQPPDAAVLRAAAQGIAVVVISTEVSLEEALADRQVRAVGV